MKAGSQQAASVFVCLSVSEERVLQYMPHYNLYQLSLYSTSLCELLSKHYQECRDDMTLSVTDISIACCRNMDQTKLVSQRSSSRVGRLF